MTHSMCNEDKWHCSLCLAIVPQVWSVSSCVPRYANKYNRSVPWLPCGYRVWHGRSLIAYLTDNIPVYLKFLLAVSLIWPMCFALMFVSDNFLGNSVSDSLVNTAPHSVVETCHVLAAKYVLFIITCMCRSVNMHCATDLAKSRLQVLYHCCQPPISETSRTTKFWAFNEMYMCCS